MYLLFLQAWAAGWFAGHDEELQVSQGVSLEVYLLMPVITLRTPGGQRLSCWLLCEGPPSAFRTGTILWRWLNL